MSQILAVSAEPSTPAKSNEGQAMEEDTGSKRPASLSPVSMYGDTVEHGGRPALLQRDIGSSSPARLAGMITDLSDETISSTCCSVSDGGFRHESKIASSSFIVHGSSSAMDDPFTSPAFHGSSHSPQPSLDSSAPPRALDEDTTDAPQAKTALSSPFSPREDRLGQQPSADNAQALYPPDACVFVAKSVVCST